MNIMEIKDNRILCTFTNREDLGVVVESVKQSYAIRYNRIFILHSEDTGEYVVTYNLDLSKVGKFPSNSILVHRRKETNTLYTINALNILVRTNNGGKINKSFILDWNNYRNSILLTRDGIFHKINTKLREILEY